MLARYARVRAGETLATRFAASGAIHYVLAGRGQTRAAGDTVTWAASDVFVLPGGPDAGHAAAEDSVLWIVTNEPQLAFERLRPPAPGDAPVEAVHDPAVEIRRQLEAIHRLPAEKTMTGKAVTLSGDELALFLIVQDGGLHDHCRTMGFAYTA